MLIIYVYNLIGYKALFSYLEQHASSSLISKLDNGQYNDDELLEVKVPFNSLYHPGESEYVRYDGTVEIEGQHYNYVKRKFINDTLYLLCIPNKVNDQLASAKLRYWNNAGDDDTAGGHESKRPISGTIKSLSPHYYAIVATFEFGLPGQYNEHIFPSLTCRLLIPPLRGPYKPPRRLA